VESPIGSPGSDAVVTAVQRGVLDRPASSDAVILLLDRLGRGGVSVRRANCVTSSTSSSH
jgi:hypothetical protein